MNAKSVFDAEGAETAMQWVKDQNRVLLTDTSMRDAHQSLFATRMRTKDMAPVIDVYDKAFPHVFSAECWGGATFDVAYRFLNEDPWERLKLMRKRCRIRCCKCFCAVLTQSATKIILTTFLKLLSKKCRRRHRCFPCF